MKITDSRALVLVSSLLAFSFFPNLANAGSFIVNSQGQPVRWQGMPISCAVNPGGVSGFTGELQQLVVLGAINDAFRTWTQASGAAIVFGPLESECSLNKQLVNANPNDGVNLVTFQDSSGALPTGVLAAAITAASGTRIVDVDIVFSRTAGNFTPVGANNATDLVAVAIHEIGHLLGLDHSGILSSMMNPFGESGTGIASRDLQSDDMITIATVYPVQTFAPSTSTISGKVTTSTGTNVKSAHVVAVSQTGGVPVASQLTTATGDYVLGGLPPGTYRVLVEPLDGPISLSNGWPGPNSYYVDGNNNFATTFLGGQANPTSIALAAGQGATANVVLPANAASQLNIELLGLIIGNSITASGSPLHLPRNKTHRVLVTGTNLTSDSNFSFAGTGLSAGATSGGTLQNGQPFREANLTLSASAALGPSNLTLSNATSTSAAPGGVIATVNPTVGLPVREGAGFGTTLAPGTIFSIGGSDLAFGKGSNGLEEAVARPLPTWLGGVSVKVGNRFAPLMFVSPGQINAVIPYEITGSSADITVFTGPGAAGNTINVTLSPTAPGIFEVPSTNPDQGAVLIGNDDIIAAPAGSVAGRVVRPANAGDVIVVYCSGLGSVTPTFPSGIAPVMNGAPVPQMVNKPAVRIGGTAIPAANVLFAGLAPFFVGLYQLNIQLPAGLPTGNTVSLQLTTFEGQTSNTVTIAVAP
ncbi:MAG: hypothetical protein A3F68_09035 [Acidobacteria bacterium RIFCSPLOWO2_12_FULL_54_10]|nr:MAG: hypothetical protein A3F68_09035 [Acidobacteria bacterium RIFCSPLOWO2_12_FULL_54_10]